MKKDKKIDESQGEEGKTGGRTGRTERTGRAGKGRKKGRKERNEDLQFIMLSRGKSGISRDTTAVKHTRHRGGSYAPPR